ncbi:MAG: hypothetical protein WC843_03880 [Candidatus Gracilibacteria bacterium]|jgi:hypothetical protein
MSLESEQAEVRGHERQAIKTETVQYQMKVKLSKGINLLRDHIASKPELKIMSVKDFFDHGSVNTSDGTFYFYLKTEGFITSENEAEMEAKTVEDFIAALQEVKEMLEGSYEVKGYGDEIVAEVAKGQHEKVAAVLAKTALTRLTPKNRKFLNKFGFFADYGKNLGVLKARKLAEGVPTHLQSLVFLAELHEKGEIDLDKLRTLKSPKLVVAPELTPEEIKALSERKENDFFCPDPEKPIFFGGKTPEAGVEKKSRKFDIRIVEGAADSELSYLPVDCDNPASDHYNNGKNYDFSRKELVADKMQHPSPSAYAVLATAMKEEGNPIDLVGVSLLDMGERGESPLVPVGDTYEVKVGLRSSRSGYQDRDLRVRRSAGGLYVPKEA